MSDHRGDNQPIQGAAAQTPADPYSPPSAENGMRGPGGPVRYAARPVDTRTKIPFGFGLTLIIAGSLMALFGVIGGIITMLSSSLFGAMSSLGGAMQDESGKAVFEAMMNEMGPIYTIQGVMSIIQGCVSVLALVGGIGLIGYKAWGRSASIMWGATAVVYVLGSTIVNFVYILPATQRMMKGIFEATPGGTSKDAGAAMVSEMMGSFTGVSQAVGAVIMIVFPILTLVFLNKAHVKKVCL